MGITATCNQADLLPDWALAHDNSVGRKGDEIGPGVRKDAIAVRVLGLAIVYGSERRPAIQKAGRGHAQRLQPNLKWRSLA